MDDLFKLNGISALEETIEQKYDLDRGPHPTSATNNIHCRKDTVQSQRYQLEDLDAKLRDADAKLKHLEAKHRRQQSQVMGTPPREYQNRTAVSSAFARNNDAGEDSSGDSDGQGRSSPQQEER